MHDRLMDCPWREQQQWLGDGRVQAVNSADILNMRNMRFWD